MFALPDNTLRSFAHAGSRSLATEIHSLPSANRPADPYFRARITGFGEQAFSIEPRGQLGSGSLRCALVATTDEQLSRGLMGRRDLGGYDGMIFRFATDDAENARV